MNVSRSRSSRSKSRSSRSKTNIRVKSVCKNKCNLDTVKNNTRKTNLSRIDDCVITNTHISLRDCSNKDSITRYNYITPIELSVDTLQYAFDTDRVKLVTDSSQQVYLDIQDFPTLLVETITNGNFKDTRRDEGFYSTYEDINTLEKITYDIQIKDYLEKGIYKTTVKYKTTEEQDIPENYKDGISTQNINYVREIAQSLNNNPLDPSKYTCDLQGIPDKYIIIESVKSSVDGQEYVICGYPDPSKMRTYLSMLENPDIQSHIAEIHKKHRTQFAQLFADMYNFVMKTNSNRDNQIDIITDISQEMYKFIPHSMNRTYLETWYKENPKLRAWIQSPEFQEKIKYMDANGLQEHKEMVLREIEKSLIPEAEYPTELEKLEKALPEYDNYVNELLLEYLNKPMLRIRYYFLIFKRHPEHGLIPAVFNMKQLEAKHTPVLEKVLDLIQIRIPAIYGILEDSINQLDRYKLFHSYAKYGDFFYITTEYLHTMSNITNYGYIYKNSITLEELIYASSRMSDGGKPFWKDVKLEYELKKFRIGLTDRLANNASVNASMYGGSKTTYQMSSRTTRTTRKNNTGKIIGTIRGNILLIYEKTYQEYVIIYKSVDDNTINVLEIKSNMAARVNYIKSAITQSNGQNIIYNCNNSSYSNINYVGKLFKLQKDIYPITMKDFGNILKNNPLSIKKYAKYNDDKIINFAEYFETELLPMQKSIYNIYNLYNIIPILSINHLTNPIYLKALIKYNKNAANNTNSGNSVKLSLSDRDKGLYSYGIYDTIIPYINIDECGYNFIIGERKDIDKKVLWVYPHINNNSTRIRSVINIDKLFLKTIKIINKLLGKDTNKLIFIHLNTGLRFLNLHIHSISESNYKRYYPDEDIGSLYLREEYTQSIVNKLECNTNYYLDYNIDITKNLTA